MDTNYISKNTDAVIEYYETINSTSERAKEIAELVSRKINKNVIIEKPNLDKKLNEVNLIIAESQTKGKGTNGRVWISNINENILMTMIFYPKNTIKELDGITYKIAEMIKLAIKDLYNIELTIKLPNDLLLNGKKICGILTESSIQRNDIKYLLVGIGFNVHQIDFNDEIKDIATSLNKEYLEKKYTREEIIVKIYNNVRSLFRYN